MIPSSLPLKTAAVLVAAALNGAVLAAIFREEPVEIEGGAESSVASLGSSFADLAQGTQSAEEAPEPVAPDTPATAEPVTEADPAEDVPPAPTAPDPAARAAPEAPSPAETAMPRALAALPPEPASPLAREPAEPAEPATPLAAEPTAPAAPDAPAAAAPEPPAETVEAEEPEPGTVLRSPRPEGRTEAFEQANRAPPEPETQPAETRRAPRGNAETNARTGSSSGSESAEARRSNQGQGRASQAGNAAASNYPGQVMGQLSRITPSVRSRGSTRVVFNIAGSGQLASVGVAQSSGSSALDREAVRLVQRAAPFPPPPPGAQTRFGITISGR